MRKISLVIIVLATLAIGPVSAYASTSAKPSTEALFCLRFVQFGNQPDFASLRAAHDASNGATSRTHANWRTFQTALLQGRPTATVRADSDAVFADCGIPPGGPAS